MSDYKFQVFITIDIISLSPFKELYDTIIISNTSKLINQDVSILYRVIFGIIAAYFAY